MRKPQTINLVLKPDPKQSNLKPLGGGNADEWNRRLNDLTVNALPIAHSKNRETITAAAVAVCRGTMDIAPADPVEGILIAQLMAANEAPASATGRRARIVVQVVGEHAGCCCVLCSGFAGTSHDRSVAL